MIYKNKHGKIILTSDDLHEKKLSYNHVQAGEARFQLLGDNKISYYSQAKGIPAPTGTYLAQDSVVNAQARAEIDFNLDGTIVGTGNFASFNTTWYTGGPYDTANYTISVTSTVTQDSSSNPLSTFTYTPSYTNLSLPRTLLTTATADFQQDGYISVTYDVSISYLGTVVATGTFYADASSDYFDQGS